MTAQDKIERLGEAQDILTSLYSDMTYYKENKNQCKRLDTILSKINILMENISREEQI